MLITWELCDCGPLKQRCKMLQGPAHEHMSCRQADKYNR